MNLETALSVGSMIECNKNLVQDLRIKDGVGIQARLVKTLVSDNRRLIKPESKPIPCSDYDFV